MAAAPNRASPQKQTAETITRLQRAVLRLAFSFHGHSPELDVKLRKLGLMVREGRKDAELQTLVDEVIGIVINLDSTRPPPTFDSDSLAAFLGAVDAPGRIATELVHLRHRLDAAKQPEEAVKVARQAARVFSDELLASAAAGAADSVPATQTSAALFRLLDEIDSLGRLTPELAEIRSDFQQRQPESGTLDQARRIAQALAEAMNPAEGADGAALATARDQLVLLTELLPFPNEMMEDVGRVRTAVEGAAGSAILFGCVSDIADLVRTLTDQLRAEIRGMAEFLKTVGNRLRDVERDMLATSENSVRSVDSAFDLGRSMDTCAAALRAEITSSDDIENLKAVVADHLDQLDVNLRSYIETESARHKDAFIAVEAMTEKLRHLEHETRSLRQSLAAKHRAALLDPLTGLLNRNGYLEALMEALASQRKDGEPLCLAVLDLDHFKDINDSYGHAAGDKVLATVAGQLNQRVPEQVKICRHGGEEFVVLLPQLTLSEAVELMDGLRDYIAGCNFHYNQTRVPVTVSCGVAQFEAADEASEDVFERADQAMYAAKKAGRNRVYSESEVSSSDEAIAAAI